MERKRARCIRECAEMDVLPFARAQSAIRTTMQHYNNVHFYGQLTAADAINALSNAHHGNANGAYEVPGQSGRWHNLKHIEKESWLKWDGEKTV